MRKQEKCQFLSWRRADTWFHMDQRIKQCSHKYIKGPKNILSKRTERLLNPRSLSWSLPDNQDEAQIAQAWLLQISESMFGMFMLQHGSNALRSVLTYRWWWNVMKHWRDSWKLCIPWLIPCTNTWRVFLDIGQNKCMKRAPYATMMEETMRHADGTTTNVPDNMCHIVHENRILSDSGRSCPPKLWDETNLWKIVCRATGGRDQIVTKHLTQTDYTA